MLATVGEGGRVAAVRTYATDTLTTFTDALLRYEREEGVSLKQSLGVIGISGPVTHDVIPIARSRWTISRRGLAALFHAPPIIINDVEARLWATRSAAAAVTLLRGEGRPAMTPGRRTVLIMIEDGVGCAVMDIDQHGAIRIFGSELGHSDFAPADAAQTAIADHVRGGSACASWEQVLLVDRHSAPLRLLPDRERVAVMGDLLGRFTINAVLASAAWHGAILTGSSASRHLFGDGLEAFRNSFARHRALGRPVSVVPCWRIEQHQPVLAGAAALVAERQHLVPAGGL